MKGERHQMRGLLPNGTDQLHVSIIFFSMTLSNRMATRAVLLLSRPRCDMRQIVKEAVTYSKAKDLQRGR